MELAWLGTFREPAETGVALQSGPGAPGGFILGREEKSECLVFQLEWLHKRLVCVSGLTWGADGEADTLGCLGADEKEGPWRDLLLQHQRACSTADGHQRETSCAPENLAAL